MDRIRELVERIVRASFATLRSAALCVALAHSIALCYIIALHIIQCRYYISFLFFLLLHIYLCM